ncbi:MAG: DNA-directed RNA polymerase subunit omega [Verrucomicrobiae bacterium]|nr:DNA-directed RNA polymerase subunit omega [Verrucomicrobiae bacterium]
MRSDLIQKASKVIPDTPLLINVVSQRVRQLNQGRAPLVNTGGSRMGVADIALMEIIEGKIVADDESDD